MRIYSVKLNGSHFVMASERVRSEDSLIQEAMRKFHPYTKGSKRIAMLAGAKVHELEAIDGVAKVSVGNFELV